MISPLPTLPMEMIDHIMSYLPKLDYNASKLKKFINQNIDIARLNLFYTEDDIKNYKPWIIHGLMTHLTYQIHKNFINQLKTTIPKITVFTTRLSKKGATDAVSTTPT